MPPENERKLQIWIVCVGEPALTDPGSPRLFRAGLVAKQLRERGCNVVVWNSTVEHYTKVKRFRRHTRVSYAQGFVYRFLHGPGYSRNVSAWRIVNHIAIAFDFLWNAGKENRPDIVLVNFPTIELAAAAVAWSRCHRVPVLVDVRDLWPDVWMEPFEQGRNTAIRTLALVALKPFDILTRYALAHASGLIAISQPILDWSLAKAGRAASSRDNCYPLAYAAAPAGGAHLADAREEPRDWDIRRADTELLVVYFGNMSHRISLENVLLSAALLLSRKVLSIRFVLAGSGEALEVYRSKARNLDNVVMPGWIDQPQIRKLLQEADVGLVPYPNATDLLQAMPNKSIEYLSGGLAIASSLGGELGREITGTGCGFIYDEHDPSSLANELVHLLADRDRLTKMRSAARKTFQKFTAETVYKNYTDHVLSFAALRRD